MAADPTYPLYPILNILAALLLLVVLLSSAVRKRWNLGLAFLCVWLFFEALTDGVSGIVWSDNAILRLYVYCDIVSRLQVACYVVKPMATLIMIRRLYKIASLQSLEPAGSASRWWDLLFEWTSGVLIPLLVSGPLYYVVQGFRFELLEGFGCLNATIPSVVSILLLELWGIVPPLYCVVFYYPRVIRVFYRHNRAVNGVARSSTSTSISRSAYLRIFIIASIDIALTLPMGIVTLVLNVALTSNRNHLPFYSGWSAVDSSLVPQGIPFAVLTDLGSGASFLGQLYYSYGTTPALAFAIFGLFGLTAEARSSYRRIFYAVTSQVGWRPRKHERGISSLDPMEFETQRQGSVIEPESTYITYPPIAY